MTIPPDPITDVQTFLQGDADVVAFLGGDPALVTTRELTREAAEAMPRRQVLIAPAGGPTDAGRARIGRVRVDVKCYAESPIDASTLDRAVLQALKGLDRVAVAGRALLHDLIVETGGVPLREAPINDAPLMFRSYTLLASEVAVG